MRARFVCDVAAAAFVVCGMAFPRPALADGVVLSPSDLPAAERAELAAKVKLARAEHPDAFRAVAAVDTHTPEGVRHLRHAKPSTTRAFRMLGRAALWPLLELVAFRAERGALSDEAWHALGAGALQALGTLRASEARPVLRAVFEASHDPAWAGHAAEGLGILGADEDVRVLLEGLEGSPVHQVAAIQGLQHCRRPEVAERLVAWLGEARDEGHQLRGVRALGVLASSWALRADRAVGPADAVEIRGRAADALVASLRHPSRAVRVRAIKSLAMVEDPRTPSRVRALLPTWRPEERGDLAVLSGE